MKKLIAILLILTSSFTYSQKTVYVNVPAGTFGANKVDSVTINVGVNTLSYWVNGVATVKSLPASVSANTLRDSLDLFIPLTGTRPGKPVSGDIKFIGDYSFTKIQKTHIDEDVNMGITFEDSQLYLSNQSILNPATNSVAITLNKTQGVIISGGTTSKGIIAGKYFPNKDTFTYPQMKDLSDTALGGRVRTDSLLALKQNTLTAGTNISIVGNTISASGGGAYALDTTKIPLAGTAVGKPVTGNIVLNGGSITTPIIDGFQSLYIGVEDGELGVIGVKNTFSKKGILLSNNRIEFSSLNDNQTHRLDIVDGQLGLNYSGTQPFLGGRGIIASLDYTPNITDLDYTQKKYVDTKADSARNNAGVLEIRKKGIFVPQFTLPAGGSTDTASLSNRINLKVNISDTAAMLQKYKDSIAAHNTRIIGKENSLGNPSTNGHVLSSTTAGVRSWVAQSIGGGVTDHTLLTNIGTNTHAQIDTHLASTSNPHSVTKSQVGLSLVDNTSDLSKPVSTAQQTALNLKANLASPTFTGTVAGITKGMVGLGLVDNTADADKPISTAVAAGLSLKSNAASPIFTGVTRINGSLSFNGNEGIAGYIPVSNGVGLNPSWIPIPAVDTSFGANPNLTSLISKIIKDTVNANQINLKTINGQSLIGVGNITISSGTVGMEDDDYMRIMRAMGSGIITQNPAGYLNDLGNGVALVDNQVHYLPILVKRDTTITGVMYGLQTSGSFTADNNNRIGLYSYSAGTFTLVASTANNSTHWTGTSNSLKKIALTAPFAITKGVYFVAFLYNNSAQTTAPQLYGFDNFNSTTFQTLDFTNNVKFISFANGNDLPASIATSSTFGTSRNYWYALY